MDILDAIGFYGNIPEAYALAGMEPPQAPPSQPSPPPAPIPNYNPWDDINPVSYSPSPAPTTTPSKGIDYIPSNNYEYIDTIHDAMVAAYLKDNKGMTLEQYSRVMGGKIDPNPDLSDPKLRNNIDQARRTASKTAYESNPNPWNRPPEPSRPEPSRPTVRAYSPPPPPQAPPPPAPIVKVPDRDVSYFDDSNVKIGELERLLFQNIGGSELVTISRQDTIDGINPYYTIISNLSRLRTEFDPISLIARQRRGDTFSQVYPIRLSERIPDSKYLLNNDIENFYYIATNGDMVIELTNMRPNELIEVEIVNSATIYEVTNDN